MTGARTMAWKELRELLMAEGRPAAQMAIAGLLDLGVGIAVPLFVGLGFGLNGWPAVLATLGGVAAFCAFMGFLGPMPLIGDAFAGERERHTLETLLAGPLADGAIVRGKMLAQYALVAGHVLVVTVAASVTAIVLFGMEALALVPAALVGGGLAAAFTASFIIGLGTLISLRAPTVKKAQERLGYAMIPIFFLPSLAPTFLRTAGDEMSTVALVAVSALVPAAVLVGAIVGNVLVFARFQRDRLLAPA